MLESEEFRQDLRAECHEFLFDLGVRFSSVPVLADEIVEAVLRNRLELVRDRQFVAEFLAGVSLWAAA